MFICARKYKKDEMVSDYSDSFVSSQQNQKKRNGMHNFPQLLPCSVFSIQLFSFILNPYMDKGFENPEERNLLFCNVFLLLYYIIYIYIYIDI